MFNVTFVADFENKHMCTDVQQSGSPMQMYQQWHLGDPGLVFRDGCDREAAVPSETLTQLCQWYQAVAVGKVSATL